MADLTPAQRKRLAKVSSEAFEALRRSRTETLRALRAEGVSLAMMAAALGVTRGQVQQWMAYEPPP